MVKVEDGVVSLEGEVEWEYQRRDARRAIDKVWSHIRGINNFFISETNAKTDNIKEKITPV